MNRHISWLEPEEKELEQRVLAEYSSNEVRKHLERLVTLTRVAGTEDELKAAQYIKSKIEEYGIESEIYEFDAYLSHPGKAELEILSPVHKSFPSLAHAFIASTPPDGIEAELVSLAGGSEKDYQGVSAKGKIVLIEPGGGTDQVVAAKIAEEKGAAAQIHINSGSPRSINIMQLRNIWGNPTPESIDKIPNTAAISICNEDGTYLAGLTKKGQVVARLKADAWRGYKKIRLPMATIHGVKEPEKYVLFASHYCSWFIGATDNAAGNALMLEMARMFFKFRKNLARSIKIAWWPGHTQGTFAGSTWYLDNFWEDVRDNAIAYLVMDGIGRIGSSGFEPRNTEEIRKFHETVIHDVLGLEAASRRVSSAGDQSFGGMGLPSFTGSTTFTPEQSGRMGGKPVWYSHTAEDTLDKLDMELISIPLKVNTVSILRLCNNPVLPFDFVPVAEIFENALNALQEKSKSAIDLTTVITQLQEIKKKTEAFNKLVEKDISDYENERSDTRVKYKFKEINACLMELSRILMPVLATRAGKYGHDAMGIRFKPIPTLQPLEKLNSIDSNSEEYKALRTSLFRERNRLSDAIISANRILDNILNR